MFPFATAMMMGNALAYTLQAFLLPVTSGLLEVPVDCKGQTPKLIIFDTLGVSGYPPNASDIQFAISRGAADASGSQFAMVATKVSGGGAEYNYAYNDRCFQSFTYSVADDHASLASVGVNKFTLNITNNSGQPHCVLARVFYGSGFNAKVGTFSSTSTTASVTTGWRPDAMIFASLWNTPFNGSSAQLLPTFGYASYNGTTLAQCASSHRYHSTGDGGTGVVAGDCVAIIAASTASPAFYKVNLTGASTTGFSHQSPTGGTTYTGYIAMNFGGTGNARAGLVDSPIATGARTIAVPGASFTPNAMFLTLTNMAAVDTRYIAGEGTGFALSMVSPDTAFVSANHINDSGVPRGRDMLIKPIFLRDHNAVVKSEGSFAGWTTGGFIASMTTADATVRKWPALAIAFAP